MLRAYRFYAVGRLIAAQDRRVRARDFWAFAYISQAPGAGTDMFAGATNRYVVYSTSTTINLGVLTVDVRTVTNMFPRAGGF
ncbi:MAG: hypothetical protein WDM91_23075 [Rhizomicrobium sp.]